MIMFYHTVENTDTGEIKFFIDPDDIAPFLEKENGSYYDPDQDDNVMNLSPWVRAETIKVERY